MLAKPLALALLAQHAVDAIVDLAGQRHIGEPSLWVVDDKQTRELAARLNKRRDRLGARGYSRAPSSNLVDDLAQLLGEFGVPTARGLRGDLERDRVEAEIIPFCVALDQGLDVVRACH